MKKKRVKKVVALIPCHNEEQNVREVIESFPVARLKSFGYALSVIVIDNNSTDATTDIALDAGATVIHETRQGKGYAMRTGFASIPKDTDYVIMLDGDTTYRPEEILRMLEPLDSGFCSAVVGSRLAGRIEQHSMSTVNHIGNWLFSLLVRLFYRVKVTDVLTGYFAWKRETIEALRPHLISKGFAIEMEMITKMARLGIDVYSVPISYLARGGESNLRPFYDGSRILAMFVRNLFWKPTPQHIQRIAFVSDSVLPYMRGGKERRLQEIAERLIRDDREVHIYTMHWWEGPRVIVQNGIYYHALCQYYPLYHKGRRSIVQSLLFGLATFRLFFERFDVVDVDHMPFFPLIAARLVTWMKGKKLYATWHEVWGYAYWMEYLKGPLGVFGYLTESLSLALPDVIISNSHHTTERLIAAGCRKHVHTVPLGADLERIYSVEPATEISDVIFVGRLITHKNVDVLLRAIAYIRDHGKRVTCVIIGDGPERAKLLALRAELDIIEQVKLLPSVNEQDELYAHLKSSKMLVLPSSREGFGIVAVEAMAAGLPVITSSDANNAANRLIEDGINGFVVDATPEAIAQKILAVLESPTSFSARESVSRYDWRLVAAQFEALVS